MKRKLMLLPLIAICFTTMAQDATVQDLKAAASTSVKIDTSRKTNGKGWIKGGLFNINLSQVNNSNWIAAGGDKFSFSVATSLNLFANRKWKRNTWDNSLELNYALVKTTTLGARKVNDRLDFISKYGYQPKKWKSISIASLVQLRSQLANGYE